MANDNDRQNRGNQSAGSSDDSESALRDELQREEKEAKGGIGDIAQDRNLGGSSSWLTDPPQPSQNKGKGSSNDERSRQ